MRVHVDADPFSNKQRLQSRFDGGIEIDGATIRLDIQVTQAEPPAYAVREKLLAE